ncbi:MAG: hypothetical protein WDN75_09155 [Bacteroidota bacterium]
MELLIEILGWTGSALVIAAYGLNSYQKIKSDSIVFQLMNLSGGAFLIIYTLYKGAFASTVINIVWVVIALSAIGRALLARKKPS